VVSNEVGIHVLLGSSSGPCAALVNLVLVSVVGVEILQGLLASLGQDLVGILNSVLGAVDSLSVALFALEHSVGDNAVAVDINLVKVLDQVLADHLALHMTSLGSIGADEAAVGMIVQNIHICAVVADGAVEEHHGDVAGSFQNLLSHIGRTGSNHVHNQQVGAAGNSGTNLVQL